MASPSSAEVARRLGLSRAAVSRFRSGSRTPRTQTMCRIAVEYAWPLPEQVEAHARKAWARGFEEHIAAPVDA